MATQTKADRSAAAKKAAATRERNQKREEAKGSAAAKKAAATRERNQKAEEAKQQGRNAAANRFTNDARDGLSKARGEAGKAALNLGHTAKATAGAAVSAGRSVAARAGIGGKKK